ncbi:hypothetical protein SASPL_149403 [Salvia splendens]|uniref:Uncharacterized protein n=1 Tax=Salvia splendens TaxID=180675 RepID=A0A8X8Z4M6_SALSN|nr:hypothetical protein SASPL_149403 [Salvia splendens]
MHTIIEAVKQKYESPYLKTPEFYVYFNDVISNDFNTLFSSLLPDRSYKVLAVPGDFSRRHPSTLRTLLGLSSGCRRFPRRQRASKLSFGAEERMRRAVEMVKGGIMALLIPALPAYWGPTKRVYCWDAGRPSQIFPPPHGQKEELIAILQKSNSFIIERMEILKTMTLLTVDGHVAFFRAVKQNMLTNEFGDEIIDETFDILKEKLQISPAYANPSNDRTVVVVVILKRNDV